jgi:membrane-associated protease RseP (regulator of RpoE activity)
MMLPAMLLLGAVEGRPSQPALLFFLLLVFPFVMLLWLLTCCAPEETADGYRAAALHVPKEGGAPRTFEDVIAPIVRPRRSYVADGLPVIEGDPHLHRADLFAELDRRLGAHNLIPLVEKLDDRTVRVVGLPRAVERRLTSRASNPVINILLLAATAVTTVYVGAKQQGVNLFEAPAQFTVGLPYAVSLLSILGIHELGHYVMARRHGVDVTLPYFIPAPMGLGTFGAFIQMKSLIKSRRAVFDIGVAGPLAGLIVALPLLYIGLRDGSPAPAGTEPHALNTEASLLLALLHQAAQGGDVANGVAVTLSPTALAAWIGVFVTALNLLPVGQLDGGHVAYALFGRGHATTISVVTIAIMVGLGISVWPGLLTWALIVSLLAGFSHMPALDDVTPPDAKRFALGALALALPFIIVLPVPGALDGPRLDSPYQSQRTVTSSQ